MPKPVVTPPFRTPLLTGNGGQSPDIQTTRDWWLYFNQVGEQITSSSKIVTTGRHANRPFPEDMPDGALYVESDRGALYQNQGGVWVYVSGTMYGTLSPDQRPSDLGPADAGFNFRTIVAPAREFIWSGTGWIEVTPLRYGTHAERLAAPVADLWNGMAWMETDRGNVIYQNQAAGWVYVSGLMKGPVSGKPSDLGINDAGFQFCATDYNHVLMWNGTGWQWGPGETGGGYFAYFAAAPAGNGWHVCDGSTVNYLKPDATTASIVLPNAAGSPCYVKGGNSFSATIAPANGATGSHTLTSSEMPYHDHALTQIAYAANYTATGGSVALTGAGTPITQRTDAAGGSGGHTHPLTGDLVANFGAYLYFRL